MRSTRRRLVICCALAGALVTMAFFIVRWRSLVESFVTARALASTRDDLAKLLADGDLSHFESQECLQECVKRWGPWFRAGYLDRSMLLERMVSDREALESSLVAGAFYLANGRHDEDFIAGECSLWVQCIALSSKAKDHLVQLLLDPCPWPGTAEDCSVTKLLLFSVLFSPPADSVPDALFYGDDSLKVKARVLRSVTGAEWEAVIRDTTAPRERTRAGALLLLSQHPDPSVFEAAGRRALSDNSEVVRLAAAGALALQGSDAGVDILIDGMSHPSWEIRFWCLHAVRTLGKDTPELIEKRIGEEKDEWLLRVLRKERPTFTSVPGG